MKPHWLRTVGGEVVNMHLILFIEPLAYECDGKFVGRVQSVSQGGKCFTLFRESFETLANASEAVERFVSSLNLEDLR